MDMSMIELRAGDLYEIENFNLVTIVLDDIFKLLQCDGNGLDAEEAHRRLERFGPNKFEHEEQTALLQFLSMMWNPLSWAMEVAALIAIVSSNGGHVGPDWQDFVGITVLLLMNAVIGFHQERNAENEIKALMDSLVPKANVKRNGNWSEIESTRLVPGDIISFKIGDTVPADCCLTEATDVSIDEASLTGESSPQRKKLGDPFFSGSTLKQGKGQAVVISTGENTFFGRVVTLVGSEVDTADHLNKILTKIGSFCLKVVGIFVLAEILVLYAGFRYSYRRGLNNILVLLTGGIPIAMPTVLSITLASGVQQLAKHHAIVTRISAIEDLADITVLCADKTGTLTTNKLTIEKDMIKTYSPFSADEVLMMAAHASRTDTNKIWNSFSADDAIFQAAYASQIENQDATDMSVVQAIADASGARAGIEWLDFKPFNPVDGRAEVTYREPSSGKVKRVTKGMTGTIANLCGKNITQELEDRLEDDVEEYAQRGVRVIAVAYQELSEDDSESEGKVFEFIGCLPMLDPPREDSKQAIEDAVKLGVKVKMVTGDQLATAKETGRRIGLGDDMYAARVFVSGPVPGGKHASIEEMTMDADGFAGMSPVHKCEFAKRLQCLGHLCAVTGNGSDDAPAFSQSNVGIAVDGATDAARRAADVVLTKPGLSPVVHAIRSSRIIIQRMRSYSIYACAAAIRTVVCFATLAFAYKFDFPPFMILLTVLLNDGTIMILSADRVLPSMMPDALELLEIFSSAITYGVYLAISTIAFVIIIIETDFFQNKFGVSLTTADGASSSLRAEDPQLRMIVYLQVALISQALIFVTRSRGFFFMERPSLALIGVFCVAQLVSSVIAAYADWGFVQIHPISGGWIGIVWVWNIIWFIPLDFIKFTIQATIVNYLRNLRAVKRKWLSNSAQPIWIRGPTPRKPPYSNRVSFFKRAARMVRFGHNISMKPDELQKFSNIQVQRVGNSLAQATK